MDVPAYRVELFISRRGICFIEKFMEHMPSKHKGKILQWIHQLEKYGPDLPRPYADVLDGPIRELRAQFGSQHYRLLYFFSGRLIVLTHGFIKKTWKVPSVEIERAKSLRTEWLARKNRSIQ